MPTLERFADSFCTPVRERAGYAISITPPSALGDWSIDNAFVGEGRPLHAVTRYKQELLKKLIGGACARYFNPSTQHMSGVLAPPEAYTKRICFGWGQPCVLRAEIPADGLLLPPQSGLMVTSGGCAVIVVSGVSRNGETVCIAAHAGLKSLIDPSGTRQYGIVEAMVAEAAKRGVAQEQQTLRSFYELPWQAFSFPADHAIWGEQNRELQAFLKRTYPGCDILRGRRRECVDLSMLIREQARLMGVGTIDAQSHTLPLDGRYAYTRHSASHLAGSVRNLVLLTRTRPRFE